MTRTSQRRLPSLGVAGLAGLLAVAVAGPAMPEASARRLRPSSQPRGRGPAPDGRRLDRRPAHHGLRRGWQDPAGAGFHRPQRIRDAGRHLQRDPERAGALLQPLFRCGHAVHAAHHLVGHRAACRRAARLSRLARLHPHAGGFRRAAVRHDQARSQGGGGARRHAPRRVLPSGALQARPDPLTSRGRRRPQWTPRRTICRRAACGSVRRRLRRQRRRGPGGRLPPLAARRPRG